jgi:hypothetical protein
MSWALVQRATNTTTSGSSLAATFSSPVTSGNLIVVEWGHAFTGTGGAPSVVDTSSNVYSNPTTATATQSTQHARCAVWYATAAATASLTVTFTPGNTGPIALVISEYSTGGAKSVETFSSGNGNSTSLSSGSMTTTGGADLVVGVGVQIATGATYTAGAGFTSAFTQSGSGTAVAILVEDQLNVAPGTLAAAITSTSSGFWAAIGVAFVAGNALLSGAGAGDTMAGSATAAIPAAAGSIARTESHDVLAGSGHFTASGSYGGTGGADVLSAAGGFKSPGAIASTEGHDTFSGAGSFATHASMARTESHDVLASSGSFATAASMARTAGADTFSGASGFTASAAMARTEGQDVFAGAAGFKSLATMARTESHDVFAAAAVFTSTASLTPPERHDTFAGSSLDTNAAASPTERGDVLAGSGAASSGSTMAAVEQHDAFASFARVSPFMLATETRDTFAGSAAGVTGPHATMAATEAHDGFIASGGFTFDAPARFNPTETGDLFSATATQSSSAVSAALERGDVFAASPVLATHAVLAAVEQGDIFRGGYAPIIYHVYANTGRGDPINYLSAIAATAALTYTTSALAYPGTWSFGVRASNAYGEEQNLDCAVTIILDATGHDITNRPLPPTGLRAFARAGGAVRVEWAYPPTRGPRAPVGFHVYYGSSGFPDYTTVEATTLFNTGIANTFVANLASLADGTTYTIGVRAYNATAEENNTTTVSVTADATGPAAVDDLVGVATASS